jgi:hypothetical protein
MLDRIKPVRSVIDTRNHYLLGNPTDTLVVCSTVLCIYKEFWSLLFKGNFCTSYQRHMYTTCSFQAAMCPLLYYMNVYFICKSIYMEMWVSPIEWHPWEWPYKPKYRVIRDLRTLLQEVICYVFVIRKVQINMCMILDGYEVTPAWNLQ